MTPDLLWPWGGGCPKPTKRNARSGLQTRSPSTVACSAAPGDPGDSAWLWAAFED